MAVRPLKANEWFDADAKEPLPAERDSVDRLEEFIDAAITAGRFERKELSNRQRASIVNLDRHPEVLKRLMGEGRVLPELKRRYLAAGYEDFSIDWERGVAVLTHAAY